ncbi:MAG TPA: 6-hydroxymethylpterin diphosphokinase MptE-like protein [Anaerolineaceae bacterium]|nr:6-hydroxymethylpterin diphosphokinase MptE-like protein [Anaerolineaceae bacterium]
MTQIRQTVKNSLPRPVLGAARETRDFISRSLEWPAATFHPWRRESIHRLAALRDTHRGERCFIIGNGPSLKNTDLQKLKSEFTIGMNRIFLAFPEIGFKTSVLLSVNDLVVEQSAQEIQALEIPRFLSWRARRWIRPDDTLHFLYTTYTGPKFARDVTGRLWEGATVTYTALQLAYHLGFATVILIGVDHSFVTKGKPNTTVVSQGDDPNHFDPAYFGKGFRWQLPDLDTSEQAYWMARKAYEESGRRVIDATVGGKLQIFPKADYEGLFQKV